MSPSETSALIVVAGGDSAFAQLLGIDGKKGFQQRVNNWKRRGLPPAVVLDHYEVITSLQAKAAQSGGDHDSDHEGIAERHKETTGNEDFR
jgi:hypothetical protein